MRSGGYLSQTCLFECCKGPLPLVLLSPICRTSSHSMVASLTFSALPTRVRICRACNFFQQPRWRFLSVPRASNLRNAQQDELVGQYHSRTHESQDQMSSSGPGLATQNYISTSWKAHGHQIGSELQHKPRRRSFPNA